MENETVANLMQILGDVKQLRRKGWIVRNVENPESDADHMYSMMMMAMLFTPKELNREKCLLLALVHDIGEIYAGDFTPFDDISLEDKAKREYLAAKRVSEELNNSEIYDLFDEFEKCETDEAKWVKMLDKLDCIVMSKYYDLKKMSPQNLFDEFVFNAEAKVKEISSQYQDDVLQIIQCLKKI
ncbi:MAG: HD domain-containing protein [Alphaproteobacteria bacterium]